MKTITKYEKILNKIMILNDFVKKFQNARLLIVTKGQGTDIINFLINNNIIEFGENKIQEIKNKFDKILNVLIHFIGRIQSNKIDDIVTRCTYVHSLDRFELAQQFAKIETKLNIQRNYFIQMNLAKEPQKGGIFEEDLEKFLIQATENLKLNICGLMLIPPQNEEPTPYFRRLKSLANLCGLKEVSMGMSNDYEKALNEGATIIRIGSYIFE